MTQKHVRILVADDHEVVRHGVRAILEMEPGWVVCGEASTGREAVAKALELHPDVAILDITMPELNGIEATRQIRSAVATAVLILTVHESDQLLREAILAGAAGYVLKKDGGRMLVDGVRAILADSRYFPDGRSEPPPDNSRALTPREREVLQLLAEGRTNKEIGSALKISAKTAETHRARIMSKLALHSMSDLVRYAIRNHIIEP